MKRLMTMLSATAVAAFAVGAANGDTLTGTGFETNYALGPLNTAQDDNGYTLDDHAGLFQKVWLDVGVLETAIVTNYAAGEAAAIETATGVAAGNNYLKLEDADLVTRYAQAGGDAVEIPNTGVYIDTLVKFTVSEDTPDQTTEDGDKLCIWVNVDSETGATNLMVKAGYIVDDMGATVPTNYVVTGAFPNGDIEGWHRLKVIAYTVIDEDELLASGFTIEIDGNLVGTGVCPFANASTYTFSDNVSAYMASSPYKLFPSLVSVADDDGSGNSTTLTSIGFKGSGSVDELQFAAVPAPTPGGDDWADDPTEIADNTPAATQYPALASSALATADAKKLTVWATDNSIDFAAVAADTTGTLVEAYLLNCATSEVEDEKDEFVLSITFDENGIPQVSAPAGKEYNVTIQLKGSNDLSTWTNVGAASKSYQFYKAVLAL